MLPLACPVLSCAAMTTPASPVPIPRIYEFRQVLAVTGVVPNVLRRWADAGIIRPHGADGKGTRRAYTFANLVEVKVAEYLRGVGLSEPALRKVIDDLQRLWTDPATTLTQAPIVWCAYVRVRVPPYATADEGVMLRLVDGQMLTTLLDASNAADVMTSHVAVLEAAIAIPIGRIIQELTAKTGDRVS